MDPAGMGSITREDGTACNPTAGEHARLSDPQCDVSDDLDGRGSLSSRGHSCALRSALGSGTALLSDQNPAWAGRPALPKPGACREGSARAPHCLQSDPTLDATGIGVAWNGPWTN